MNRSKNSLTSLTTTKSYNRIVVKFIMGMVFTFITHISRKLVAKLTWQNKSLTEATNNNSSTKTIIRSAGTVKYKTMLLQLTLSLFYVKPPTEFSLIGSASGIYLGKVNENVLNFTNK